MQISNIVMRDAFFEELYRIASQDRRVVLLTDDFGAPSLDKFRRDLNNQYINMGIAEQNMVTVAAGLALGGKIVYTYAIAPFITMRCYEQTKLDLCCMNLPVTAIGVGAGFAYGSDGPTHQATEDIAIMRALPGMTILSPSDVVMTASFAEMSYKSPGPKYIRLDRAKLPLIYGDRHHEFDDGLTSLKSGRDLTIITTGIMVHRSLEVTDELARHSVDAGIVDLYRLKPVNQELLLQIVEQSKRVATVEEHSINGGIGSIVAEIFADNNITVPLKRIAIPDRSYINYGGRNYLHASCGLDANSITNTLLEWIQKDNTRITSKKRYFLRARYPATEKSAARTDS